MIFPFLNESNLTKVNALDLENSNILLVDELNNDVDIILTDMENFDIAKKSKSSSGCKLLVYEPVVLSNIFQTTVPYFQITKLSILESHNFKLIEIHEILGDDEIIGQMQCGDFYSIGNIITQILKLAHIHDVYVFKLILAMSWLSIFLSHLKKKKV